MLISPGGALRRLVASGAVNAEPPQTKEVDAWASPRQWNGVAVIHRSWFKVRPKTAT